MANQNTDEKAVEDIVYKLKSQGLFDQMRKECLNDVDTKPAYQNLRQRVEGYVSRFLSQQTWSSELNKNQLRDSLRRQINQSGMLSSGVERIIEQVVNPKIFTIIKPKIDEIVCKHLGLDPEERQRQLEDRKTRQQLLQKQQLQQQQNPVSDPQPLLNITPPQGQAGFDSVHGNGTNPYTAYSPSANWHRPFGTMLNPHLNSNYQLNPTFQQGFGPYGMTSPLYPYVQPGWGAPPFPGMPPPIFTQPPPPIPTGQVTDRPIIQQTPLFTEPPPPLPTEPYKQGQNVDNVPAPPPEPGSPGLTPPGISPVTLPPCKPPLPKTENLPDKPVEESPQHDTGTEKDKTTESKSKPENKPADGIYNILKDIPLPIPLPRDTESPKPTKDTKKRNNGNNESKSKSTTAQDNSKESGPKDKETLSDSTPKVKNGHQSKISSKTSSEKKEVKSMDKKEASTAESLNIGDAKLDLTAENLEKLEVVEESTKQYTFSWTKGPDVDEVSSMTVSSVHTSDLSSFEDDLGSASEQEDVANEDKDVTTERSVDTAGETADVSGSQSESMEVMSPVKASEANDNPTVVSPPKPKTLISLKYNYSDSDEDETREERKARIAYEKEERYAKRLQRRAELDAKKKEREEERLRLKEEKKSKPSDSDKTSTSEVSEVETPKPPSPPSDPQKSEESEDKSIIIPSSPKKKTKQELKEQLREQKVMEKKLALRRQRTRNRRYTSEEFTSIFTEKSQPFSSQSYTSVEEVVVEECVVETTTLQEETVDDSHTPECSPARSPATPTQDEPYVYPDGSTSLPTGIPVYEIQATPATSLTIGQVVHETRSRTRKLSDERKSNETHSTGRPGSPFSDISDMSKPDSIGDTPERRSKRRKIETESPQGADAGKVTRRTSATSPSDVSKAEVSETRSRGKRYNVDDLYKPRTTHRRSLSPPPSPPIKAKVSGAGGRRRSSPIADTSDLQPTTARRRSNPSPPPLAPPQTTKRYDADDLYKPRVPSSRSSRYQQRQPVEPEVSTLQEMKRELPFAVKEFTEEGVVEERAVSPTESERKRTKRPISLVDFGEAARRTDQRKPQDNKFRGRTWGKERTRFDRKPQRKYYDGPGGWSDVEKTGSRSPASSHSSGSGSHYSAVRRDPAWKEAYDSEPGLFHPSGSRSPSKHCRGYEDTGSSLKGRSRSPVPSASGIRPPSPQNPGFETMRPPSPYSPGDTPPSVGIRRPPTPPSPGIRRPPSPASPGLRRPPSPPSPGVRRPPSPGLRRPPSPPTHSRRPPSPPSPELHRSPSPSSHRRPPSPGLRRSQSPPGRRASTPPSPQSDLGPRTRRHRNDSPEMASRARGPKTPLSASPIRRQTRNSLYRPVMTSPRGKGWDSGRWGNRNTNEEGHYLRNRSSQGGGVGRSRDGRAMTRGGRGRRDSSPPPPKRPKR